MPDITAVAWWVVIAPAPVTVLVRVTALVPVIALAAAVAPVTTAAVAYLRDFAHGGPPVGAVVLDRHVASRWLLAVAR